MTARIPQQQLVAVYSRLINSLHLPFIWGTPPPSISLDSGNVDCSLMAAFVLVPIMLVAVKVVSSLKISPYEAPRSTAVKKTQ